MTIDVTVGDVHFSSCFDSGNLRSVTDVDPMPRLPSDRRADLCSALHHRRAPTGSSSRSPLSFFLEVSCDAEGSPYEVRHNRCWFFFSATWEPSSRKPGPSSLSCRFTILNLSASKKIFDNDYRPVFRLDDGPWARLPQSLELTVVEATDPDTTLCGLPSEHDRDVRIAWSHTFRAPGEAVQFAMCYPYTYAALQRSIVEWQESCGEDTVFVREVVARSIQGRTVDLLTVSSASDIESVADEYFSAVTPLRLPQTARPPRWKNSKPVVLLTARVHPGETPSSYVLHGLLDTILRRDRLGALLREHFVFCVVPMINPDGVVLGHYRTDSRGVNLNRCYCDPSLEHHPAVFAVRELFEALAGRGVLHTYIDFHAHANRRGCFVFGNAWDDEESQAASMLLPKLIEVNTAQHLELTGCDFTSQSMLHRGRFDDGTKEGTGRVALARSVGLVNAYTLEVSYQEGGPIPKTYTIAVYRDIGRGIAESLLDLRGVHPRSKLRATPFTNVDALRRWLRGQLQTFYESNRRRRLNRKDREGLSASLSLPLLSSTIARGALSINATGE